ncbi:MAG: DsbA family oxidoreductase [Alphaproteobacteria bacterium]
MPEGTRFTDLTVDIFADPICPWCFVGKRRLERALGRAGVDGVEVRWRAFQLNPQMPPGGMDRGLYLATKFGGSDRARHVYDAIRRAGETEGIHFAFARIQRTPNTVAAHRLLRFAARVARTGAVMEGLFAAYFLEGRDIGDVAELAAVAGAAGCDATAAAAYLRGDEDRAEVLAEDAAARAAGIGGVPHFVVAGRYQLPGAQSPEVIARTIELARATLARSSVRD